MSKQRFSVLDAAQSLARQQHEEAKRRAALPVEKSLRDLREDAWQRIYIAFGSVALGPLGWKGWHRNLVQFGDFLKKDTLFSNLYDRILTSSPNEKTALKLIALGRDDAKQLAEVLASEAGKLKAGEFPEWMLVFNRPVWEAFPNPDQPIVKPPDQPIVKPPDRALSQYAVSILIALKKNHPALIKQVDLEQSTGITRKTVGIELKTLREAGYVHRPRGQHSGEGLTEIGLKVSAALSTR